MRRIAIGVVGTFLWGLGCMGGEAPSGLEPTAAEVPPAVVGLEPYVGRWEALTERDGQSVVLTPCDRENHFVEIRSDGEGGWELVAGVGDELRILSVSGVEPSEGGVRISVDGGDPLVVRWLEPDRTATFAPLFGEERFVAPAHRAEVPDARSECP